MAAQAVLPDSKHPVAKAVSLLGKQGATVQVPMGQHRVRGHLLVYTPVGLASG